MEAKKEYLRIYQSVLFLGIIFLSACGKQADLIYPDINGSWYSKDSDPRNYYSLVISDNHATYGKCGPRTGGMNIYECEVLAEGKPRIRNNKLKIALHTLKINQSPHIVNESLTREEWRMTIDDRTYISEKSK